jgi:alpha-beta hydrolase superfamily lysophospholipase
LKKVDEAVDLAMKENPDAEITLLAHSIGGWIARVWLSEWTTPDLR